MDLCPGSCNRYLLNMLELPQRLCVFLNWGAANRKYFVSFIQTADTSPPTNTTIFVFSTVVCYKRKAKNFPSHLFQLFFRQCCPVNVTEFFNDAFDRDVLEVGGVVLAGPLSIPQRVSRHLQVFFKLMKNNRHFECSIFLLEHAELMMIRQMRHAYRC